MGERTERPAVICCALSGALADRDQCPGIPYTPAEYAAEARRIVDAGGVHIHVHARRPAGTPSHAVEDYRAIGEAIRAEVGGEAILNFSTGTVGVSVERRVAYLEGYPPEVAAINMGSLNYAKFSRSRRAFVFEMVFANPFEEIVELLGALRRLGIKPEHECFDVGHVGSLAPLGEIGLLDERIHVDFVMGVLGGIPATARNLAAMADNLPAGEHHWSVIGIGRVQWQMLAASLALGGSIRVGFEDNFYLPSGEMARSNGELVAEAHRLCLASGRRRADVAEARAMLGLPGVASQPAAPTGSGV
ncbi:MAG: 3-keto-5-aminohexanoate cleavage protein [Thermoleophilia bacterium]|nr:3-keto-5-aminohexanoate cleavage protein [Thermoleophilia bacterium]